MKIFLKVRYIHGELSAYFSELRVWDCGLGVHFLPQEPHNGDHRLGEIFQIIPRFPDVLMNQQGRVEHVIREFSSDNLPESVPTAPILKIVLC